VSRRAPTVHRLIMDNEFPGVEATPPSGSRYAIQKHSQEGKKPPFGLREHTKPGFSAQEAVETRGRPNKKCQDRASLPAKNEVWRKLLIFRKNLGIHESPDAFAMGGRKYTQKLQFSIDSQAMLAGGARQGISRIILTS
jgi:hypothetical protein